MPEKRDVTRALKLVEILRRKHDDEHRIVDEPTESAFNELVEILHDIDARTGRRDPSARTRRK